MTPEEKADARYWELAAALDAARKDVAELVAALEMVGGLFAVMTPTGGSAEARENARVLTAELHSSIMALVRKHKEPT